MSIIYEALKKVEDKNLKAHFSKNSSKHNFLILIGVVFLLLFGLSLYTFKKKSKSEPIEKNNSFRNLASTLPKQQEVNIIDKLSQPPKNEIYKLEGIIYDTKKPFVIINGKRLTIGDMINGARILNIEIDRVELDTEDGKKYILLE